MKNCTTGDWILYADGPNKRMGIIEEVEPQVVFLKGNRWAIDRNDILEVRQAESVYLETIEKEREAFKEEMRNGFKDLQRVEKERDQYKRLWTIRGKALGQPCLECGYQQEKIVFERSDPS